ncbi:hypothetical protein ABZ135_22085 [Streptomyces sp. NPDC006339]|uniref:hypothetical protein n=1 Tax=Streptomyces sp. NPDC006339 TaxID=3156755 RepID=UPI0033AC219A
MAISNAEQQLRGEARTALLEQIKKLAAEYEDPAALLRLPRRTPWSRRTEPSDRVGPSASSGRS